MKYQIIPVTPYQQNCSLIWCEKTKQAALIDPGGEVQRLVDAIDAEGLTLAKVFLTHGHLDHVGGTSELVERYQLPIEGPHQDDLFWLNGIENQAKMMGFPPVKGFTPSRWLQNGDRIEVGEVALDVYHCPGHTPGHVIFHHEPSKTAFVGDVLFNGSIGRTDFPRGDYDQLVGAIRDRLWPLGDDVTFVPGHGPKSTFGYERANNPFVADSRFG
mgnify:CR=1 FL=1